MSPPTTPRRPRSRPDFGRRGTAAIEFALLSPLLLILLTGILEVGMAVYQAMQVQVAAEAGALYAAEHGSGDLAQIQNAVTNATGTAGITATPAPQVFCGCPDSAGVVSQGADCTTPCSGGAKPGTYVRISATITRTSLVPIPFFTLPLPATFAGQALIRTQ